MRKGYNKNVISMSKYPRAVVNFCYRILDLYFELNAFIDVASNAHL